MPIENHVAGDLTIEVNEQSGEQIRLDWKGKSNDRQPGDTLVPFFEKVAAVAKESGARIEMHFEELEFFNSSTITVLIQLIQELRDQGVRLALLFNGGLKWQKLSCDALRMFERADGMLELKLVG